MRPSLAGSRPALPRRDSLRACCIAATAWLACGVLPDAHAQVYRWVDDEGVIHLSSEKPPPGVQAERLDIKGASASQRSAASSTGRGASGSNRPAPAPASPQQLAERQELLGRLRNRECVIALEALERKTGGTQPTSAGEIKRLQQTAELNCSQDPVHRREQEAMAARLRVANGPACAEARNRLADLMAKGSAAPREQVRAQQAFVDEYCTPPVR